MTSEQIARIKETSYVLLSVDSVVADAFYDHLFRAAPDTRRLFSPDLAAQKRKLVGMLASLIGVLGRPDIFSAIVRRTAQEHAWLGVLPRHYDIAETALISALSASLGHRFTPEVENAWRTLYATIESEMLAASQSAARP